MVKGKIIMFDPTIAGAASRWVAVVADKYMGIEFMKEFARNEPVITRDYWLQLGQRGRGLPAQDQGISDAVKDDFCRFVEVAASLPPPLKKGD